MLDSHVLSTEEGRYTVKQKRGELVMVGKESIWLDRHGMTLILLYVALRLTISLLVARPRPAPVDELYAWLVVLLYWFFYVPGTVAISFYIAKLSGIVE